MNYLSRIAPLPAFLLILFSASDAQEFSFGGQDKGVTIVYSKEGPKLDSIAAHLLASDIMMVTGSQPKLVTDAGQATGNVIVIGNISSDLMQRFIGRQSVLYKNLQHQWECFGLKILDKPTDKIHKALIVAGSDTRGTAFGVFTVSEKIGVSPWYWWADVPVKKQKNLTIIQKDYIATEPSVKFRGIFINDEDWGLQPWAAKTFEPETGDIGPKTYAKVFELLLRLKANLIWPAMHPSTKAFYHYPLNKEIAEDYAIVIGSSHAEPMLRNNVSEWNETTMGRFNYLTNKETIQQYWESRVRETIKNDVMYTMGIRGVHDSWMEGVKDAKEAVPVLERVIEDQRQLLKKYHQKDIKSIPQVFTAYKEVLDIYDNGLLLPDDITLVWPDDNYGYIQRLNTDDEKKRPGGGGVYYHASYWGRPHDYLWLSSTHPSLIREEMMKAFENGSNRIWVLNVGDIKPLEYNIQLFMDMAYQAQPFKESSFTKKHLQQWHQKIFGAGSAKKITEVLLEYYDLAFERRPEFMGWSQTEPTTRTTYTSYNHFSYGDEAQQRMNRYDMLVKAVKELRKQFSFETRDAFYQLVYYPVVGASWMNKKFLYRDKAYIYSKQNRISAWYYASQSKAAYDSIIKETNFYNSQLRGGKWKGMMSMQPRELPVYLAPVLPRISTQKGKGWDLVPEGYDTLAYENKHEKRLPSFSAGLDQSYFIDVFLTDSTRVEWTAHTSVPWIILSRQKGLLLPAGEQSFHRLWVRVDWNKAVAATQEGFIEVSANGRRIPVYVRASRPAAGFAKYKGFAEENGVVSIYATHYQSKTDKAGNKWISLQGLGHTGASLQVSNTAGSTDTSSVRERSSYVVYTFYSFSNEPAEISVFTLPTHPLNKNFGVRCGISIDDGPVKIVDFKTIGRSEEWKQNVLRNVAVKKIGLQPLKPGVHTLKIYAIDPGVVLDRILVKFGDALKNYGVIPETWKN